VLRLSIALRQCLSFSFQVDVDMIIERQRISVMNEVVEQLHDIAQEWTNSPSPAVPEVDWLKMRQLEFQENLRSRNALEKRLEGKGCILCENFDDHVRILGHTQLIANYGSLQYLRIHERKRLLAEIETLKFALSDQNLELLPDYEQRIAVLKDLKFIDENSTVLLKGRVACEVRTFLSVC